MMMNIFEKIVRYFKSLLGYDNIHLEAQKEVVSKSTDYSIFLYKNKWKCINVVFDQKIINGKHYIYSCDYFLNGEEVNYTDEQYKQLAKDIYRYPQNHEYRSFRYSQDDEDIQSVQKHSSVHRNGAYIYESGCAFEIWYVSEENGKVFLDASLRGWHFERSIFYPLSQKQRCYSLHYLQLLTRQIRYNWSEYINMDTKSITEDTQDISQDEAINEIIIYNPVPEFGELSDEEWKVWVHDPYFCKEIECSE